MPDNTVNKAIVWCLNAQPEQSEKKNGSAARASQEVHQNIPKAPAISQRIHHHDFQFVSYGVILG